MGERCQVDEEKPESDSLLFFQPESATPVASVTLNTKVWALAYGREGARQGPGGEGGGEPSEGTGLQWERESGET